MKLVLPWLLFVLLLLQVRFVEPIQCNVINQKGTGHITLTVSLCQTIECLVVLQSVKVIIKNQSKGNTTTLTELQLYTKAKPRKNTQLAVLQIDARVDSMASAAMKDSGAVGTAVCELGA